MYVITLLLATFIFQTKAQSGCGDYIVTVYQNDFLEGEDVKLNCTYTNKPDITTILWTTRNNTNDPFRPAYSYYNGYPDFTEPSGEFKGRLEGNMDGNTHILTIVKANSSDNLNEWTCTVSTLLCSNTNKDSKSVFLTDGNYSNVTLLANNEVKGFATADTATPTPTKSFRSTSDSIVVTCYTLSDPASQVTIKGIETHSQQTCQRVVGTPPQPYKCSVTGTISNDFWSKVSKQVYCSPAFQYKDISVTTTTDPQFKINTLWRWWEILVLIIVIAVCVALTSVVVRFLILYCCLQSCKDRDFYKPICVRVCCMPSGETK